MSKILISLCACAAVVFAQSRQGSGPRMSVATVTRDANTPLPRVGVLAYCPAPITAFPNDQPANTVASLAADGRFGSVTLVAADATLPSSANLSANFDCVVASTDLGCGLPMPDAIADSAANALAAYAQSGGGVVLTAFGYAQPRPSLGLGAAIFAPGLSPLLGTSIDNSFLVGGINTTNMSTDPACAKIVQGVAGSMGSSYANDVIVAQNSTHCVAYDTGLPAVAVNRNGNVVGFNSSPANANDQAQSNYRRLFANSVYQACTAGASTPEVVTVPFDIKPASCPNTWEAKSNGVLPAAILGTRDLPVSRIDPESIRLAGVAPDRFSYADVATPYSPPTGKTSCADCTDAGRDGIQDLELKFDSRKLAAVLPAGNLNACVLFKITGNLKPEFGGGAFIGEDVVSVKKLGN